jgi:hypothetical protein
LSQELKPFIFVYSRFFATRSNYLYEPKSEHEDDNFTEHKKYVPDFWRLMIFLRNAIPQPDVDFEPFLFTLPGVGAGQKWPGLGN